MIDLRECLFLTFTYDHASGVFFAQLSNGARFAVERSHVGGKLENALSLFKRQVIANNSGKYVQARGARGELTYSYNESQVQKVGVLPRKAMVLPEIELDLEDLEL